MKDVAQLEAEKAAKLAEVAAEYDAKIAAASADPLLIEAREIVGSVATGLEKNPLSQGGYDKGQYVRIALAALRRGMELAAAPLMPVTAMTDEHVTTLRTHLDLGTFYKHPNVEAAIHAILLARRPVTAMTEAEIEELNHLERWLTGWCEIDLSEVIADNGGTAGQFVQHEAKSKIAMIRATLARGPVAVWPGERPQDHWTVVGAIKSARALIEAGNDLCFAAETTGGVAGRDAALCAAIAQWAAERDKQKQVLRIIEIEGDSPEIGAGRIDRPLRERLTNGIKPTEPEWIDWHGGECPVPAGTRVEVRFKTGHTAIDANPEAFDWKVTWVGYSIVAYRILGGAA